MDINKVFKKETKVKIQKKMKSMNSFHKYSPKRNIEIKEYV